MSKYYFCYSHALHKYIHNKFKIRYVCAAKNEHDDRKFWLYELSPELKIALDSYRNVFKGVDEN